MVLMGAIQNLNIYSEDLVRGLLEKGHFLKETYKGGSYIQGHMGMRMPHTQQNICLNRHFATGVVLKITFAHGYQTLRVRKTTRPRLLDKGFYVFQRSTMTAATSIKKLPQLQLSLFTLLGDSPPRQTMMQVDAVQNCTLYSGDLVPGLPMTRRNVF